MNAPILECEGLSSRMMGVDSWESGYERYYEPRLLDSIKSTFFTYKLYFDSVTQVLPC